MDSLTRHKAHRNTGAFQEFGQEIRVLPVEVDQYDSTRHFMRVLVDLGRHAQGWVRVESRAYPYHRPEHRLT